jgi:opacity protein-like surface antigen
MRVGRCILLIVLGVGIAAPAAAQWVATPYAGINVGGDVEAGKGGLGGSFGYFGDRVGFEFDFQRFQHFFKDADVSNNVPDSRIDFDTDAWSFMGNVVAPLHLKHALKLRPYAAGGLGAIRARFDSADNRFDAKQTNLGFNLGGGAMYALNQRIGLRSDLRYFRGLVDDNSAQGSGGFFKRDYGFWRFSIGVTFGLTKKNR